jgi:anthranilate synthase/aminodeoxychorismate synthase-like glutamine amidotransferase
MKNNIHTMQQAIESPKRILLLDNYDSFTYNLYDYLCRMGAQCTVVRNNWPVHKILENSYQGIVLSPGPGRPEDAGHLMPLLEKVAGKTPVLGICLGHQAIGMLLGAEVVKAIKPMHGKLSVIWHTEQGIFWGIPQQIKVVRYHSLVLKEQNSLFSVTARSAESEIMAIQDNTHCLTGIQFHPEAALTEYGLPLLGNWLRDLHIFN